MPCCSILQCKNISRMNNIRNGGVSYHRFPKVATIKEKWIDATGRINWMPTKSSTICSEHFLEDDFVITGKGYRYLKSTAIPTLKILKYLSQDQTFNDVTDASSIRQGRSEECDLGRPKKRCFQTESVSVHSNIRCDVKSANINTASCSSSASSSINNKLKKQLEFCKEKIKKQSVKIKRLQSSNLRLTKKMDELNVNIAVFAALEEKFGVKR